MRPIDADAMIEKDGWCTTFHKILDLCDDNDLKDWLDEQPTLDVEPVRHGWWVWFENRLIIDIDDPECIGCTGYECSECGNNEYTCIRFYEELSHAVLTDIKEGLKEILTNYCPNCGAKMNKEE